MNGDEDRFQERWNLYEINYAADKIGIRLSSLLVYISQKRIQAYEIGGRWRIRDVEVERFIERRARNRANCGRKKKAPVLKRRKQNVG